MSRKLVWGPWQRHVPGPCPVPVGAWCEAVRYGSRRGRLQDVFRMTREIASHPAWEMGDPFGAYVMVERYRIATEPSAMRETARLQQLALNAPKKEKLDA